MVCQAFAQRIDAGKVLVQKSGYYGRAARANAEDLRLIELHRPGGGLRVPAEGGVIVMTKTRTTACARSNSPVPATI